MLLSPTLLRSRGGVVYFLPTMRALPLLLLLTSCATLDSSRLRDDCRRLYDICLNACPTADANRRVPPGPSINSTQPMTDVAQCTNQCNEQARRCERE